jgi:exosortase/archaeosortase family protein
MALLVAAVAGFPASWRQRLAGLAGCLVAVYLVNVARLVSLYFVGV